jgi:hypothetical protein
MPLAGRTSMELQAGLDAAEVSRRPRGTTKRPASAARKWTLAILESRKLQEACSCAALIGR